jgi:hypothetical protein
MQYAPWQTRGSLVPFNKVLVLSDFDTDLAVVDGTTIKAGSTQVIPIWWPQTAVQALHDKLKMICVELIIASVPGSRGLWRSEAERSMHGARLARIAAERSGLRAATRLWELFFGTAEVRRWTRTWPR